MKTKILQFLFLELVFSIQAQEKPNILWIITDDQRADALECYNKATTGKSESSLGYVMSPNYISWGCGWYVAYLNGTTKGWMEDQR